MFGLKFGELLLIFAALLLLFGTTRLPQLGSSLGSAIRNFKKGFSGEEQPEDKAKAGSASGGQLSGGGSTDAKSAEKASEKA